MRIGGETSSRIGTLLRISVEILIMNRIRSFFTPLSYPYNDGSNEKYKKKIFNRESVKNSYTKSQILHWSYLIPNMI